MEEEKKYLDWTTRYLLQIIEKEEEVALNRWLLESPENARFFIDVQKRFEKLSDAERQSITAFQTTKTWIQTGILPLPVVEVSLPPPPPQMEVIEKKQKRKVKFFLFLFLITFGGYFLFTYQPSLNSKVYFSTQNKPQQILLPDGTKVFLNKNSKLNYDKGFDNRTVRLEGEGFFEVTEARVQPFEIQTNEAVISTPKDAIFNLRSYKKEKKVEITTEKGRVLMTAVPLSGSRTEEVTAKIQVVWDKSLVMVERHQAINPLITQWRTEKFAFNANELGHIFEVLSRHFDVSIAYQDKYLNRCLYSGTFAKKDLQAILKKIATDLQLELKKEGDGFLLVGIGCGEPNPTTLY